MLLLVNLLLPLPLLLLLLAPLVLLLHLLRMTLLLNLLLPLLWQTPHYQNQHPLQPAALAGAALAATAAALVVAVAAAVVNHCPALQTLKGCPSELQTTACVGR